jgi:two-component system nitrogen regulation response regulator GlnG
MRTIDGNARPAAVLVADDDLDFREAMEAALLAFGLRVLVAASVDEVCRLVAVSDVDLVLTDVRMPGDGATLPGRLHASHPGLPVVVMTGFDEPGVRARVFADGAIAYLEKPIDLGELRAVIDTALTAGDGSDGR